MNQQVQSMIAAMIRMVRCVIGFPRGLWLKVVGYVIVRLAIVYRLFIDMGLAQVALIPLGQSCCDG